MQTYLIFATVAEQLSFTKAADILNLPRATVSTSIQTLETRLRVQLLNRTTRSVSLTLDGQVFLERCQAVLQEVNELERSFQQLTRQLDGCIKIDMPANFAREIVLPHLHEFISQYPQIEIDLSSHDAFIDVVSERVDLVIRSGDYSSSHFEVRKLLDIDIKNYASPSYLKAYGEPTTLAELSDHFLVTYSPSLNKKSGYFQYLSEQGTEKIKMRSKINVNSTVSYTEACLGGLGIAQLPAQAVEHYVHDGRLIEILKPYCMPTTQVDLIYLKNKQISQRVLVFMNWLESLTAKMQRRSIESAS